MASPFIYTCAELGIVSKGRPQISHHATTPKANHVQIRNFGNHNLSTFLQKAGS